MLKIVSIHSPDVELNSWEPSSEEDIFIFIQMEIGEDGVDGADVFDVMVASPEALRCRSKIEESIIVDHATIVVSSYRWWDIEKHLSNIVRRCDSGDWEKSLINLRRYFGWEYDDYQTEG